MSMLLNIMVSTNPFSVSVNDYGSLALTEKPAEDLDAAGDSPQPSESSSATVSRKRFRTVARGDPSLTLIISSFSSLAHYRKSDLAL
ncbi:hypothetical protein EDB81DRAFT_801252 [Dactylonectria macrodidyma]|uniref:Uncharacterized protein n=1 Tax=Dactylonectria macrodidyma TaxID=307937 RepID=A0A9P9EJE2_9HYPO|nr:hypothetical protein EDB81DRAFT_801252 [Dactylonectria macrodidyma]